MGAAAAVCVCVCVAINICCLLKLAPTTQDRSPRHSNSTAKSVIMARPEVRRRRSALMAKTAMFATVLVATASGVSAFVVDPGGGMLLRSGVADLRGLAGRPLGRFREGFGPRDRLPARRGRTGSYGRLVS